MTKKIYMGKPNGHVNQHLGNLVSDKQLLVWDKNNPQKYKKIYITSKAWIFAESEFFIP